MAKGRHTALPGSLAPVAAAGALAALAGIGAAWSQAPAPRVEPARIAQFGIAAQGTPACASCHGFHGEGVAVQGGPRLAGLNADYLERQLDAFKHGGRDSSVMGWVVRGLTPDQRAALAKYYASLPPLGEGVVPDRDLIAFGEHLAVQGDWPEKVPPCASCHGADGLGVNELSPPLAGQRADYVERQLIGFRQNVRRDDPLGLMRGISSRLTRREIRAVAAYYATLPAATPPAVAPRGSLAQGARR